VFGSTTKLVLNLFDIPLMKGKLDGYVLEIEDCGFPCLEKVIASTESSEAFLDADVVILLGGAPRYNSLSTSRVVLSVE
jgi:malate dehydrogenase